MAQINQAIIGLSIQEMPCPELIDPPPADLPYDDEEPEETQS